MKFSAAAVLAAAAGAHAWSNVTYTTKTVTALTTYCPGPTEITHGATTYTITEATTLTITDCPCTVVVPVTTTSAVVCHTCTSYANTTAPAPTTYSTKTTPAGTISATVTKPTTLATAGAGKAAALSGAGLAGIFGLAAFVL